MSADVLLPLLLEAIVPRHIVELAGPGESKAELLLERSGASLECGSAFDPERRRAIEQKFGARFVVREGLALNRLASISGKPDLVILGGDPNYYTVLQALRLIARGAGAEPFPTTIVHDTGWPYGRRDAYPAPEAVPPQHLHPHAQRGVYPGRADLDEQGLFGERCNALFENTEHNGVRPAIDELVGTSGLPLERAEISAFYGLTLLVDRRRLEALPALAKLVGDLSSLPPIAVGTIDALERARVDAYLAAAQASAVCDRSRANEAELLEEVERLRDALGHGTEELTRARARLEEQTLRVAELDGEKGRLEEIVLGTESELSRAAVRIAELEAQARRLEATELHLREQEARYRELESRMATLRAPSAPVASRPVLEAPRKPNGSTHRPPVFGQVLRAENLDLARRRIAKLKRDPKAFFAHSRFATARKLARLF